MAFIPIAAAFLAQNAGTIAAVGSAGAGIYGATQAAKKPPTPKTPGATPAPVTGETDLPAKVKKYRPATQMFKDEDLRLGGAGKLGL
jgi:hypothetical protein